MAGLDPAIHQSSQQVFSKAMGHRVKLGDDDLNWNCGAAANTTLMRRPCESRDP
jgi:hypothetical protein